MLDISEYKGALPAWCPGCGNFGILGAVKKALAASDLKPSQVLLFSGIGQAAKLPHYLHCNVFNGLHGRAIPAATGAKLADHKAPVLVIGGDGDMYGEGGNHLLHAIRRNPDLTVLVHDNKVYGLTKGQASPTSDLGMKTKVQSLGVVSWPLNPLALAISQQCSFVARSFSGAIEHLAGVIRAGMENHGFSLIEILQPCVSFNKLNTHAWFKERIYEVTEPGHDPYNQHRALDLANEWGAKIPIGVLYKNKRPSFESQWPQLQGAALVDQPMAIEAINRILAEL
jgi:2-oxoglutarate/2-oxoacid ferredoxin oxidoreductase subunit beta